MTEGKIRVGIGGWTFEPWRETFYPKGLPHARELAHASRHVTAIEVNGTFYRTQKPETFAAWHDEVPDDFIFALKAPRYATNRRVLADAGESVARFIDSGIDRLKTKLGPINWQMAATKAFQPEDFAAFLSLLPKTAHGMTLRHVVEVRHASFMVPEFVALLRDHGVTAVFADDPGYPFFFDPTADFVYLRLQCAREGEPRGYSDADIETWAARATSWAAGRRPAGLPLVAPKAPAQKVKRDVFSFFINGFKPKAPLAAMRLIDRLGA